jgi:hypothetical protein
MEVQLRYILISTAIGDQAVAALVQMKLAHQALHGLDQVAQEISGLRWYIEQAGVALFGYQQYMEWIAWLGMMKGDERFGLAQALNRQQETHVRKHPTDYWPEAGQACNAKKPTLHRVIQAR